MGVGSELRDVAVGQIRRIAVDEVAVTAAGKHLAEVLAADVGRREQRRDRAEVGDDGGDVDGGEAGRVGRDVVLSFAVGTPEAGMSI